MGQTVNIQYVLTSGAGKGPTGTSDSHVTMLKEALGQLESGILILNGVNS